MPPRDEAGAEQLWQAIRDLEPYAPTFVSVTYGAGGSTRDTTVQITGRIARETSHAADGPPDLRRAHPRPSWSSILQSYAAAGVRNILALRGDPKEGPTRAVDADRGRAHLRPRAGRAGPRGRVASASASRPSPRATRRRRPASRTPRVLRRRRPAPARSSRSPSCSSGPSDYFDLVERVAGARRRPPDPAGDHADHEPGLVAPDGRAVGARGPRRARSTRLEGRARPGRRAPRGRGDRHRAVRGAARRWRARACTSSRSTGPGRRWRSSRRCGSPPDPRSPAVLARRAPGRRYIRSHEAHRDRLRPGRGPGRARPGRGPRVRRPPGGRRRGGLRRRRVGRRVDRHRGAPVRRRLSRSPPPTSASGRPTTARARPAGFEARHALTRDRHRRRPRPGRLLDALARRGRRSAARRRGLAGGRRPGAGPGGAREAAFADARVRAAQLAALGRSRPRARSLSVVEGGGSAAQPLEPRPRWPRPRTPRRPSSPASGPWSATSVTVDLAARADPRAVRRADDLRDQGGRQADEGQPGAGGGVRARGVHAGDRRPRARAGAARCERPRHRTPSGDPPHCSTSSCGDRSSRVTTRSRTSSPPRWPGRPAGLRVDRGRARSRRRAPSGRRPTGADAPGPGRRAARSRAPDAGAATASSAEVGGPGRRRRARCGRRTPPGPAAGGGRSHRPPTSASRSPASVRTADRSTRRCTTMSRAAVPVSTLDPAGRQPGGQRLGQSGQPAGRRSRRRSAARRRAAPPSRPAPDAGPAPGRSTGAPPGGAAGRRGTRGAAACARDSRVASRAAASRAAGGGVPRTLEVGTPEQLPVRRPSESTCSTHARPSPGAQPRRRRAAGPLGSPREAGPPSRRRSGALGSPAAERARAPAPAAGRSCGTGRAAPPGSRVADGAGVPGEAVRGDRGQRAAQGSSERSTQRSRRGRAWPAGRRRPGRRGRHRSPRHAPRGNPSRADGPARPLGGSGLPFQRRQPRRTSRARA